MKFILQLTDNELLHDISTSLLDNIKYHQWLGINHIQFCQRDLSEVNEIIDEKRFFRDWIPVGTLEFVHKRMEYLKITPPSPLNYPIGDFPFYRESRLQPKVLDRPFVAPYDCFVKSADKVKEFDPFESYKGDSVEGSGRAQITCLTNSIISEYRCFVLNGKLKGMHWYKGSFDPLKAPSIKFIERVIREWTDQPPAYTLDIMRYQDEDGSMIDDVVEAHHFYSCGMYGFKHPDLCLMYSRWWKWFLSKTK